MLTVNKDYNPAYTERELVGERFPELLNSADEATSHLKDVQQIIAERLPRFKQQLPSSNEEFQQSEGQLNLQTYLLARSMYGFAHMIWATIDKQCDELAVKINENDLDEHNDIVELKKVIKCAITIPFEEPLSDRITGFLRFCEIFNRFSSLVPGKDFSVIKRGGWMFRDMIGTICNYGLTQQMYDDAMHESDPTESNIGELLDSDEPMRIY